MFQPLHENSRHENGSPVQASLYALAYFFACEKAYAHFANLRGTRWSRWYSRGCGHVPRVSLHWCPTSISIKCTVSTDVLTTRNVCAADLFMCWYVNAHAHESWQQAYVLRKSCVRKTWWIAVTQHATNFCPTCCQPGSEIHGLIWLGHAWPWLWVVQSWGLHISSDTTVHYLFLFAKTTRCFQSHVHCTQPPSAPLR